MGYRDTDTALRHRIEQLERQVASIPALEARVNALIEENARWKAEAERLAAELAKLRPREQDFGDVEGRLLLAVVHPSGKREVFGFDQPVVKIGKLRSVDLYLESWTVSRLHAVIEMTDTGIQIIDLGGSGTIVNGKRVDKVELAAGDEIRIAEYRIHVGIRPS